MKNIIVRHHRAVAVVSTLSPIVQPKDRSLGEQILFHSPGHSANWQKTKTKKIIIVKNMNDTLVTTKKNLLMKT